MHACFQGVNFGVKGLTRAPPAPRGRFDTELVSSPAVLKEKYVCQKLCTKLGLSDVAIPDSGWPIRSLPVTFSDFKRLGEI